VKIGNLTREQSANPEDFDMFRARRVPLFAAGLVLPVVLAACGGSSSGVDDTMTMPPPQPEPTVTATSGTPVVTIHDFAFSPKTLVINKGMQVKFVQEDTITHNVVGAAASSFIHSPLLTKGQSYTVTFSKAGTYNYICAIHPNMQAKVIVQ
jgi:plastocyanin